MITRLPVEIIELQQQADDLCRRITADNPEFFGIPEANQHYASGVLTRVNFAAMHRNEAIGLLSLEFPYDNNANIYWMGVVKNFHRKGVGKELLEKAKEFAAGHGATTMTVETLAPSECDENYLRTYRFYAANRIVNALKMGCAQQ